MLARRPSQSARLAVAAVGVLAATPTRSKKAPAGRSKLEVAVIRFLTTRGRSFADSIGDYLVGHAGVSQSAADESAEKTLRDLKQQKVVREVSPGEWALA